MQNPILPPPSQSQTLIPEMSAAAVVDDPVSSSLFDWSDILDFNLDDHLFNPNDPNHHQELQTPVITPYQDEFPAPVADPGRVRKRDPRLVCENFQAGLVPCACPELDEKLEEEELGRLGLPGKKRARTVRAVRSVARCQVPDCEADISELKGYHRRHRVCLGCANASVVVLDAQGNRYCQQCGKFHILSDFDEGKRSCRRKLERHNNRRRRKPADSKCTGEKESQNVGLAEDLSDDSGKDGTCLSSPMTEKEILLESEGRVSTLWSTQASQNIQNDNIVSLTASGEAQIDAERENNKYRLSPSFCDNKSTFSSMCPTGRISFKLYDWNPAEFPRRLRHQIFQWLASMPVELEGYVRPGCTILTLFIAMPKFMWVKLLEDPAVRIHELFLSPGNMLSGKGTVLVHVNNMMFRVMRDGTSVVKFKVRERTPNLYHINPMCFEAGKPIEFIACGSNLLQPKFRFLVSFAGKYLSYNFSLQHSKTKGHNYLDHQLLKICVPPTPLDCSGPAFIEVENESGLSNFIPILIGDKDICEEMKMMQQRIDTCLCPDGPKFSSICSSCEVPLFRQTEFSEFILDVAWLLKEPELNNMQLLTSVQMQRFINLLNFLMENGSIVIMERVLSYMKTVTDKTLVLGVADSDIRLLQSTMDKARGMLHRKVHVDEHPVIDSTESARREVFSQATQTKDPSAIPSLGQVLQVKVKQDSETAAFSSLDGNAMVPLLNKEVVMCVNIKEKPVKPGGLLLTKRFSNLRPLVFLVATAAVCFGICTVFLHPEKVNEIAVTIRRCLFDDSRS